MAATRAALALRLDLWQSNISWCFDYLLKVHDDDRDDDEMIDDRPEVHDDPTLEREGKESFCTARVAVRRRENLGSLISLDCFYFVVFDILMF